MLASQFGQTGCSRFLFWRHFQVERRVPSRRAFRPDLSANTHVKRNYTPTRDNAVQEWRYLWQGNPMGARPLLIECHDSRRRIKLRHTDSQFKGPGLAHAASLGGRSRLYVEGRWLVSNRGGKRSFTTNVVRIIPRMSNKTPPETVFFVMRKSFIHPMTTRQESGILAA